MLCPNMFGSFGAEEGRGGDVEQVQVEAERAPSSLNERYQAWVAYQA